MKKTGVWFISTFIFFIWLGYSAGHTEKLTERIDLQLIEKKENTVYQSQQPLSPGLKDSLPAPTLFQPTNMSVLQQKSLYFNWQVIDANALYHLQISTTGDFNQSPLFLDKNNISGTSFTLDNITKNKYYWRLQASWNNQKSKWSEIWSFTIIPPTNITATSLATTKKPRLYAIPSIVTSSTTSMSFVCTTHVPVYGHIEIYDAFGECIVKKLLRSSAEKYGVKSHIVWDLTTKQGTKITKGTSYIAVLRCNDSKGHPYTCSCRFGIVQ